MKDEMKSATDVQTGYHDLIRHDALSIVPAKAGSVLDVGGGIGATSVHLKDQGRADRVFVLDIIEDGFLSGVDAHASVNLDASNAFAEINETFDTILCLDVLEHLVNPWSVIRQLTPLLRPGGVIVASLPNIRHWDIVYPLVVKGTFDLADKGLLDRTHMRWFTRKSAVELMTCSGLKLKHIEGRLPAARWRIANALTLGRMRGLFELQYLIRVGE
jgi:2-polyprenyl-3-methyl-5-hydroxy-6-metoxy-1,4-benzoquinol methylase